MNGMVDCLIACWNVHVFLIKGGGWVEEKEGEGRETIEWWEMREREN